MIKLLDVKRKIILFPCCFLLLISAFVLALSKGVSSQQLQNSVHKTKQELIKHIESLPEQPLRIVGNDNCPLQLVETKVQEIPASLFTRLTGAATDLITVSSVPEVRLVNTSGKLITGFILVIRDPDSKITRSLVQTNIAIAPGDTYIVKRSHFTKPEKITLVDKNNQIRHTLVEPEIDAEKYWIHFADLSNLFTTIGLVNFGDGSSWIIKEEGEVR